MIGTALVELADIANCVSGDFHLLHLQMRGAEFDTMHKKVLKKYYEESSADYDTWAEAALMYDDATLSSPNGSAVRMKWQEYCCADGVDRNTAVGKCKELIEGYLEAIKAVFLAIQDKEIGVANILQTRYEYWDKELRYFNARRI